MSQYPPLYEYKHFNVPSGSENEAINYFSKFYWELVQTQTIDYDKVTWESGGYNWWTNSQTHYNIHEKINYVTINLRRNLKMPNYDRVVGLEKEYLQLEDNLRNLPSLKPSNSNMPKNPVKWTWGQRILYVFVWLIIVDAIFVPFVFLSPPSINSGFEIVFVLFAGLLPIPLGTFLTFKLRNYLYKRELATYKENLEKYDQSEENMRYKQYAIEKVTTETNINIRLGEIISELKNMN
jgi:hypothetical protein